MTSCAVTGLRKSIIFALALGAVLLPLANAEPVDRQTLVTFNSPVELPGQVLAPGTYEFRKVGPDVVQVFTKDGHAVGSFLTIPVDRLNPPYDKGITLEERSSNAPAAVSEWFYSGDRLGVRFVYEK